MSQGANLIRGRSRLVASYDGGATWVTLREWVEDEPSIPIRWRDVTTGRELKVEKMEDDEQYMEMQDKEANDGPQINEDRVAPKSDRGEPVPSEGIQGEPGSAEGEASAPGSGDPGETGSDQVGEGSGPGLGSDTGGGASQGGGTGN